MKGFSLIARLGLLLLVPATVVGQPSADRREYIAVNGTRLFTEVVGEGIPVVVVHGGPGLDHTYLLPQLARLGRGFQLIFYDQRAAGKSPAKVDTNSMTMETFVEDLDGVRKAYGLERMNLLAHSWGGLVAMFYAIRHPDRLQSLILLNSTPASAAFRDSSFTTMRARTSREDSLAKAAIVASDGFKTRDPAVMASFFRLLFKGMFAHTKYADSLTITFDSTYPEAQAMLTYLNRDGALHNYDLFPRLGAIRCPTLIVGGDHDMVSPASNERLHDAIRGSEVVLLKDCGHFPFIEAGDQLFPLLRKFLRSVSPH